MEQRLRSRLFATGLRVVRKSHPKIIEMTLMLDTPPQYSSKRVIEIRTEIACMSQTVFAPILNVSPSTVQKWEAPKAHKHPSGAAAKLLQLIEKNGIEAVL